MIEHVFAVVTHYPFRGSDIKVKVDYKNVESVSVVLTGS